jgi:glycosyltransferase involved in cell wall biosynthesis
MGGPLVSVIVPTFNKRPFIAEALDSVLAQDYEPIEVVVSDNGSTDGTVDVLREYGAREPDRIRLLLSDRNTGIPSNFNRALAAHTGELIAWLDGDDVMLPGKLRAQVDAFERNPDAVACCHDADVFESATGASLGRFSDVYNGGRAPRDGGVELLFDPTYMMLPSALMRRSSAVPEHGFDERLGFANDWLFDIELFRRGRCVAIPDMLVRYRRHGDNVTASAETAGRALEEKLIVTAIVAARYPELDAYARRYQVAVLLNEAKRRHDLGDAGGRRAYARSALRHGGALAFARTGLGLARAMRRRRA